MRAMKALAGGLLLSVVYSAALVGQEKDRSLERISVALQQPLPITGSVDSVTSGAPRSLGIFTLVPPEKRGEIVRVSVPIGELVSRAFRSVAAANRRRHERAIRREVEAALKRFADRQPSPRR
jgi:hypothetical protein